MIQIQLYMYNCTCTCTHNNYMYHSSSNKAQGVYCLTEAKSQKIKEKGAFFEEIRYTCTSTLIL